MELVSVSAAVNMMIDDAFNLWSQICLIHVEDVVIDQGNLIDSFSRWILLPELIPKVEFALIDLALLEMEDDL